MVYKVSKQKVDELLSHIELHAPDMEISYKNETPPGIIPKLLALGISILGLLGSILSMLPLVCNVGKYLLDFEEKWDTSIANALVGKYILLPTKDRYKDFTDLRTYIILRHEYQHILDQRSRPIWFNISYLLLPLPMFYSYRSHWELRALAHHMVCVYEEVGHVPESIKDWVRSQFHSSLYLWMWKSELTVYTKVEEISERIEAGDLELTIDIGDQVSWF